MRDQRPLKQKSFTHNFSNSINFHDAFAFFYIHHDALYEKPSSSKICVARNEIKKDTRERKIMITQKEFFWKYFTFYSRQKELLTN